MKTATVEIVDRGRGPQLSTSRITVLATSLTNSARHGPASGSSEVSRNPTVISSSPLRPAPPPAAATTMEH